MRVVRELVEVHTLWRAPSTPTTRPTPGGPQGGRQTDATCSHAAAGTSEQQHTPCASAADAPAAAAAESVQQLCSLFRKPQTLACRSRGRLSTNRELIREPAGGESCRGNNARLQQHTTIFRASICARHSHKVVASGGGALCEVIGVLVWGSNQSGRRAGSADHHKHGAASQVDRAADSRHCWHAALLTGVAGGQGGCLDLDLRANTHQGWAGA